MYEQLSLFDLELTPHCIDCKHLIKDKYRTEGKTMDFCNKKVMYIDRCLTAKESCFRLEEL